MSLASTINQFQDLHNLPIIEAISQVQIQLPIDQTSLLQNFMAQIIPKESCLYSMSLEQIYQFSKKPMCGININGLSVKCMTCSTDHNSTYCIKCFDENQHTNHFYTYHNGQGMCDCGYQEAIKEKGFCKLHNGKLNEFIEKENKNYNLTNLTSQLFYLVYCMCYLIQALQFEEEENIYDIKSSLKIIVNFLISILQIKNEIIWEQFAKILFFSKVSELTTIADIIASQIDNLGQDYINITDFIHDYKNNSKINIQFLASPMLLIYSLNDLNSSIQNIMEDFQHFIVQNFSGQYIFRQKVSESFYLKQQLIVSNIINEKLKSDIWSQIIPQTHNSINIVNNQLEVSQFFEISNVTSILYEYSSIQETSSVQSLLKNIFGNITSLILFKQYNQYLSDNLIQRLKIQFFIAERLSPIDSYEIAIKGTTQQLVQKLNFIQTFTCCQKQPRFIQQIFENQILNLSFLIQFSYFAYINLPRFITREPQNDEKLFQQIYLFSYLRKSYKSVIFSYFYSNFYKKSENSYLQKVTEDIEENIYDYNNFISTQNTFQNVITILFQHGQSQFIKLDQININNDIYLHQLNSQFEEGDTNEVQHQFSNLLTSILAVNINIYQLYNEKGVLNFSVPFETYILDQIEIVKFNPKIAFKQLIIFSTNVIVSKSIFDAKGFVRLGEKVDYFLQSIYNLKQKVNLYDIYNQYQLIQQVFMSAIIYDQDLIRQLFYQILNLFGFYNLQTDQFEFKHKFDDEKRRTNILLDFIKLINIITFSQLKYDSTNEIISLHVQQYLLMHENCKFSQISSAFNEEEYYSPMLILDILNKLAIKTEENISKDLYSSNIKQQFFKLTDYQIQNMSFYDPHFVDIPQFSYIYEQRSLTDKVNNLPNCFTQKHQYNDLYETFLAIPEMSKICNELLIQLQTPEILEQVNTNTLMIFIRTALKIDHNNIAIIEKLSKSQIIKNYIQPFQPSQQTVVKQSLQSRLIQLKSKNQPTDSILMQNTTTNITTPSRDQLCQICMTADENLPMCQLALFQPTSLLHRLISQHPSPAPFIYFNFPQKTLNMHLNPIKLPYTNPHETPFSKLSNSHKSASLTKNFTLCTDFYDPANNFVSMQLNQCGHLCHQNCNKKQHLLHSLTCSICRKVSPICLPIQRSQNYLSTVRTVLVSVSQIMQSLQQIGAEPIDDPLLNFGYLEEIVTKNDEMTTRMLRLRDGASFTSFEMQKYDVTRLVNILIDIAFQSTLLAVLIGQKVIQAINCSASLLFMARFLVDFGEEQRLINVEAERENFITLFESLREGEFSDGFKQLCEFRSLVIFGAKRVKAKFVPEEGLWEALLTAVDLCHEMETSDLETVSKSLRDHSLTTQINIQYREALSILSSTRSKTNHLQLGFKFKQHYISHLKSPAICAKCGSSRHVLICLYCGEHICMRCDQFQQIYYHQRSCYLTGAYYSIYRNVVMFPDLPNFTYVSGGPFLDTNSEDDIGAKRRCGLERCDELVGRLSDHLFGLRTVDLDIGVSVVNFAEFVRGFME